MSKPILLLRDESSPTGWREIQAIRGLSAYQTWLKQPGNAGKTEQEFLESLVGTIEDGVVNFTPPSSRSNIVAGETVKTVFGKVSRWFADLKTLAFKDKVNWNTDVDNKPTSMPASDVPAWAKAAEKPKYTAAEVGASPSNHNHDGVYVSVVAGKGLSSNDYTNVDKAEVAKVKAKANKSVIKSATLTVANWVDDTEGNGYWKYTVSDADISNQAKTEFYPATDSDVDKMEESGVRHLGEKVTGGFVIKSESKPTENIGINYIIFD